MTEPPQGSPLMNITPELCAALAKLQADLPEIARDRKVEVETKGDKPNYSYSYATLAYITKQIMPKLGTLGLSYSAYPGTSVDGKGMCLRYFLLHLSGGFIGGEFPLSGEGGIQTLGGRITYAKRYALLAVTGLAAEEDDDAARAQAEDEAAGGGRTATRKPRPAAAAARVEQAATNTARRRAAVTGEPPAEASAPAQAEPVHPPTVPDDPASGPQQQTLAIQFKKLNVPERDRRLQIVSGLMGRDVGSIKDLSAGEAHELIDLVDIALRSEQPMETLRTAAESRSAAATAEGTPEQ
jgi:hypothetical protein